MGPALETLNRPPAECLREGMDWPQASDMPDGGAIEECAITSRSAREAPLSPAIHVSSLSRPVDVANGAPVKELLGTPEDVLRLFSASDAILLVDPETICIQAASEPAARLYGYSVAEMKGMRCATLSVAPEALPMLCRDVVAGAMTEATRIHRRRDGTLFPAEVSLSAFQCNGRHLLLAVIRDASARVEAERARRESEQGFRAVFENAIDGITIIDSERFTILDVNPAFCRVMGAGRETLIGREVLDFHPNLPPERLEGLFSHIQTGQPLHLTDIRMRLKDGRVIYIDMNAFALRFNGQSCVAAFFHDVTERRNAEQALKESEARFRRVVEEMPVLFNAMDDKGQIVLWNRECEKVLGYTAAEMVGNPAAWERVFPEKAYRESVLQYAVAAGHDFRDKEIEVTCKDGSKRVISHCVVSGRIPIPGLAAWSVGVDVTERRRMAEAVMESVEQERLRIGQELHDNLGQQLTGIGMLAKKLATQLTQASSPQSESAQEILDLIRQAHTDARDLSRALAPLELDEAGLTEALWNLVYRVGRTSDVACDFNRSGTGTLCDSRVATQFYLIAREAVTNALKHSGARHLHIHLALKEERATIRVRDDGKGLPERWQYGGGLGLRIMRRRAQSIGGELIINSCPQGGTIIVCAVPGWNPP